MISQLQSRDVVVLGAGMAGLAAARVLVAAGRSVIVLDKGRGLGGRMATRRLEDAVFDHGAQYFTARDPRFASLVGGWAEDGNVAAWCDLLPDDPPARRETRWVGRPGMTAPAKRLAAGLDVLTGVTVTACARTDEGWVLRDAAGVVVASGRDLLLAAPVPQALDLLAAGGLGSVIESEAWEPLRRVRYRRALALMAVLEGPSGLPAPGAMRIDDPACPLTWIADNQAKGVSTVPAVTAHSTHALAVQLWDEPDATKVAVLSASLRPRLASAIRTAGVHRWKFAQPFEPVGMPCFHEAGLGLAIAGDAFPGGRVEGAFLSGLAAAEALSHQ